MKPRFSLRAIFVVTTLIAVIFGWRQYNLARAEAFVQQAMSGKVKHLSELKLIDAKIDRNSTWGTWWLPAVEVRSEYFSVDGANRVFFRFPQTVRGFSEGETIQRAETRSSTLTNP